MNAKEKAQSTGSNFQYFQCSQRGRSWEQRYIYIAMNARQKICAVAAVASLAQSTAHCSASLALLLSLLLSSTV